MHKPFHGCWPTMITPFTDDNRLDFQAVKKLTEWFVASGCDGIFAVCQSSEMFFLDPQEKLDLARAVVDFAEGKAPVFASGHTADDKSRQVEELGRMAETGVDAVVLVSNRLAAENEDEGVLRRNFEDIRRQLPETKLGIYECPYPYLRILSTAFIRDCAVDKSLVSLKDVSCNNAVLRERIAAAAGTGLSLFNANTATLLDFFIAGGDGYNGVMGNFHIDIYKWLYTHYKTEPELSREVGDFLTLAGVTEARAYPVSAKYHCGLTGVSMSLHTRARDKNILNENARLEIESLFRMEKAIRRKLGLPDGDEKPGPVSRESTPIFPQGRSLPF
jgi:4-hydroxy-tetrahydrodipicolinate synthase